MSEEVCRPTFVSKKFSTLWETQVFLPVSEFSSCEPAVLLLPWKFVPNLGTDSLLKKIEQLEPRYRHASDTLPTCCRHFPALPKSHPKLTRSSPEAHPKFSCLIYRCWFVYAVCSN